MKLFKSLITTILLSVLVLAGSAASAKKDPVSSQTKKEINSDIAQVMKEFNTVGLGVAVVRNGQIVYANSWGYKDLENKKALKNDDIFRIASISKSFTATAIMQLVEQGKVSLDEDVSDLVGFKVRNPKFPDVKITVKMLLSHTSSLNDSQGYFTLDVIDPSKSKDYYKAYNDYKPGTGYEYANLGFNTLGTILERISGERFDQYIVNHILKPLNVYGGYWVASLDKSKFVNLYNWNNETKKYEVQPEAYDPRTEQIANYQMGRSTPIFSPTGGMKISPTGLATVMMMHMGLGTYNGKKIISKQSAETMQSAQFGPDDEYDRYCFALRRGYELLDGYEMIGHVGEAYGVHTLCFGIATVLLVLL
ncbi:MAG: beta-lactamase family protein [Bacteroidales bacterium]|jgi:CubicO group peptidase (beta-lactamase class C family)|nr:beta-lactamase family protein [Bacteroidales bacterium]